MKTVLPRDTDSMDPKDLDELRYAVRINGESGFVLSTITRIIWN